MSAQPASVLSNNLAVSLANETHLARKPQTFWDMALRSIRQDKLTLTAIAVIVLLGLWPYARH